MYALDNILLLVLLVGALAILAKHFRRLFSGQKSGCAKCARRIRVGKGKISL